MAALNGLTAHRGDIAGADRQHGQGQEIQLPGLEAGSLWTIPGGLNNIRTLEDHGIRFIAVTQELDTDQRNPASRFLLEVLGAAAEFERSLIRERTQAGRVRYKQDYAAGRVGKTVYSRSGKNLAIGRPKKIFNRDRVIEMHQAGASRVIAKQLGLWGWVPLLGPYSAEPKYRSGDLERASPKSTG